MALSATATEDDLHDMGLHPMDTLFTDGAFSIVQIANYTARVDLLTTLQDTDFDNFTYNYEANGSVAFAVSAQKGKRCGFSIPIIRCAAEIPIIHPVEKSFKQ